MTNRRVGWIIRNDFPGQALTWLRLIPEPGAEGSTSGARISWTNDSQLALRFGRKEDADNMLLLHRELYPAVAEEHSWGLGP